MVENGDKLITALADSLTNGTFVKATLGNYRGPDEHLQKLLIRPVTTRKGGRLFFLYRGDVRDTAKNFSYAEGIRQITELIAVDRFRSAHLFTTENDWQFELGKKGKSRLNIAKPTFKTAPQQKHDREKKVQVAPDSFYLRSLGITDDNGRVRDRERPKWKQINRFVEILASVIDQSELKDRGSLQIVDMGSGKGYLTFAAYDFLKNIRGINVKMTGVDTRSELVDLCSDVASAAGFDGLDFAVGSIADFPLEAANIVIALHACNTATDDAIYKGIRAGAEVIIVSPCCHQELRPQITPPPMLKDVLKHGVMLERTAEMLTDSLRSLLLEREGYSTKMIEFVGIEDTPKNNMIVGTRLQSPHDPERFDLQIASIKNEYGLVEQRLETLLSAGVDSEGRRLPDRCDHYPSEETDPG